MDLRETLQELIKTFKHFRNDKIACESKGILEYAAKELQLQLDTPMDLSALKQNTDLIIAGALLYAMAEHDNKYNGPGFFSDQHLYSREWDVVLNKECFSHKKIAERFKHIGQRALITKELPFTGTFESGPFVSLAQILSPSHFEAYSLNTDPLTMDPTEINRPGKELRIKAMAANKWNQSFGFDRDFRNHSGRTIELEKRFDQQERKYSNELKKLKALHALSLVASPFTLFTLTAYTGPKLQAARENAEAKHNQCPLVKLEFSREEYEAIRDKRNALKESFPQDPRLTHQVSFHPDKPQKACMGFDDNGLRAKKTEDIKKVVMICDKSQAKRWSLSFLDTATKDSYKETIQESIRIESGFTPKN